MKVAFLTRDHAHARNREGTLNGLEAVAAGIAAAFEGTHEFVRISVPGTWWDVESPHPPEMLDLAASAWFANQWWTGKYDLVLNNVPGFEPILRSLGVKHALVLHVNWWDLKDAHAHELDRFVRFAPAAIVPTKALQARASGLGIPTVYAPFPLLGPPAGDPEEPSYDVVWAGRDELGKGIGLLEGFLQLMDCRASRLPPFRVGLFLSFCSAERATRLLSPFDSQRVVRIGAPQSEYWEALRRSKTVLCASQSEAYACAMVEGVLAGAVPVVPGDLGLDHLGLTVEYWDRTSQGVYSAVSAAVHCSPDRAQLRAWGALRYNPRYGSLGRLWRDQVLPQALALAGGA